MRLITALLILISSNAFAQQDTVYPAGCYMSIEELQTKAPTKHCRLQVSTKKGGTFLGFEANDYTLSSADKCFSKKDIRDMFAYSDGNVLYLNGAKHDLQGAYVQIVMRGKNYMAFLGARSTGEAFATMLMGSGSVENSEAGKRYLYALDMKTGKSYYADEDYMSKMLTAYPDLKALYDKEANKGADETLLKYLNLCNQAK